MMHDYCCFQKAVLNRFPYMEMLMQRFSIIAVGKSCLPLEIRSTLSSEPGGDSERYVRLVWTEMNEPTEVSLVGQGASTGQYVLFFSWLVRSTSTTQTTHTRTSE